MISTQKRLQQRGLTQSSRSLETTPNFAVTQALVCLLAGNSGCSLGQSCRSTPVKHSKKGNIVTKLRLDLTGEFIGITNAFRFWGRTRWFITSAVCQRFGTLCSVPIPAEQSPAMGKLHVAEVPIQSTQPRPEQTGAHTMLRRHSIIPTSVSHFIARGTSEWRDLVLLVSQKVSARFMVSVCFSSQPVVVI